MTEIQQPHRESPSHEDDEDEVTVQKNMTAEQVRESKQLNQLNDQIGDISGRPDEKLALEAKLFVALEVQENARRVEKEKELASVKLTPSELSRFIKESRLEKGDAERMLKMNKGNLKSAMFEFVRSFPQLELCRDPANVLGL